MVASRNFLKWNSLSWIIGNDLLQSYVATPLHVETFYLKQIVLELAISAQVLLFAFHKQAWWVPHVSLLLYIYCTIITYAPINGKPKPTPTWDIANRHVHA